MEKSYSIKMNNRRVVAVEVDGVTYKTPDDIPDENDREAIRAMIARRAGAKSEKEFDGGLQRQFQEELREMQSRPAVAPKIFAAVFLGIAAMMLLILFISSIGVVRTLSREQAAPGQVVRLVQRPSTDSDTGNVTMITYPIVKFTLPGKAPWTVQLNDGSSSPQYAVGDPVTVLVDPDAPHDARIKSLSSSLMMWILPVITLLVGAAFGAVGLYMVKLIRAKKN
jgi:hypothetical protein